MHANRVVKVSAVVLAAAIAVSFVAGTAAPVAADEPDYEIVPVTDNFAGKSYSKWAIDWYQWILEVPGDVNPMFDETGADCHRGQSDDDVWFLTGAMGGTIERECTVPEGKALFFPVYNWMYFPFADDPPLTNEDREWWEAYLADGTAGMSGTTSIDGESVADLADYQVGAHHWFNAHLPSDNFVDRVLEMYGIGGDSLWGESLALPFYVDGVFLMVDGLDEGEHIIEFTHSYGLSVTYDLTVTAD